MTEPEPDLPAGSDPEDASSRLFDLRYMIGGLFVVYGLILVVAGFFTTAAELRKAAGININLWLGLGMLVLGALFLVWARARPLRLGRPSALAEQEAPPPDH